MTDLSIRRASGEFRRDAGLLSLLTSQDYSDFESSLNRATDNGEFWLLSWRLCHLPESDPRGRSSAKRL